MVTSLFYDTGILLTNLLIVFEDANVVDMVIDVLALEFFTYIDDEFKRVLIGYDDSFLDEMLISPTVGAPGDTAGAAVAGTDAPPSSSTYSERSSSWQPPPGTSALTETLFELRDDANEAGDRR